MTKELTLHERLSNYLLEYYIDKYTDDEFHLRPKPSFDKRICKYIEIKFKTVVCIITGTKLYKRIMKQK